MNKTKSGEPSSFTGGGISIGVSFLNVTFLMLSNIIIIWTMLEIELNLQ